MGTGLSFPKQQILGSSKHNPFPNKKFLDSSKLKEIADDNFKFDENGGKFSKCVENTIGKGEVARYKQFLSFSRSVFNRLVF